MVKNRKRQTNLLNFFGPSTKKETPLLPPPTPVVRFESELEAMTLEVKDSDNEEMEVEEEEEEVEEEEEEEEEEEVITRRKRKRVIRIEEDSSSQDEPLRLTRLKQMEQCDTIHDEELDFLDKSDILQERTRGKQVSRYSEALKRLADKKSRLDKYQGEKGPMDGYLSTDDDDEEEEEEEKDSEFVVDDDMIDGEKNTDMESEMMIEMPVEFTSARTKSFSMQLSIYIEYLIEKSLNPDDPIILTQSQYNIAKNAVIRRVQSYKDSIVTSDVWLSSFKEAVDKYPNWFISNEMILEEEIRCDACRSNKPARVKLILSSDDSPSKVTLNLGTECSRKGELYHKFHHFELHIFKKVNQEVTEMMSKRIENIPKYLIHNGFTRKLASQVKEMFNHVNQIYNIKTQRTTIVDDSSSSNSDDSSSEE